MKLKVVLAAVAAIGLSGCATTQPEPMPESYYTKFAKHAVALEICLKAGYLTPSKFAKGRQNLSFILGTWKYDEDHLNDYYEHFTGLLNASPSGCRAVEGDIAGSSLVRSRHIKGQQEAADRQYQQWVDAAEALNQNKTTWCNKVGNTVMCR